MNLSFSDQVTSPNNHTEVIVPTTADGDYEVSSTNISAPGGTTTVEIVPTAGGAALFSQTVGSGSPSGTISATPVTLEAGVSYDVVFTANSGTVINQSNGPTVLDIVNTSVTGVDYIPADSHGVYADDAAAIAGGLVAGDVYLDSDRW